eukprot:CAMPEP_0173292828 /NCGR_PEP_ID=MMETSP1143-20121109/12950_1 /TAXON_ID=483371 /ORGANISM="non described non described, Strain CCMP2298" /LENGTH=122 /DNA_ID=CAMNT_0014232269 /DNA_START=346 /DNA_END=711 /DNA_ORIENTATION=-
MATSARISTSRPSFLVETALGATGAEAGAGTGAGARAGARTGAGAEYGTRSGSAAKAPYIAYSAAKAPGAGTPERMSAVVRGAGTLRAEARGAGADFAGVFAFSTFTSTSTFLALLDTGLTS